MEKKGYNLIQVIIIIVVTSVISGLTTGVIFTKSADVGKGMSYSELVADNSVKEFLEVYSEIVGDYYEDVNKDEMVQKAIDAMMQYLDESYTTYLDEDAADSLMEQLNGKYEGIGITVKDRKVINVIAGSPAEKNGIMSGDEIVSVNDMLVEGKTTEEIVYLIKSNADNVILEVLRNGNSMTFVMAITTLSVPSVSYYMTENAEVGYMQISVFASKLSNEVETALNSLKEQGAKKMIIDLRNNTGGYLDEAYKTASLFLDKGKLIYSLSTKDGVEEVIDGDNNSEQMPIAVLINGSTASAAEILAGALKDSYGATLLGLTSFGKGKVQHTYTLKDGGLVKYTSSKWLRPNGECVDNVGITPDYIIENEYILDNSDPENIIITGVVDKQYEKAMELLNV